MKTLPGKKTAANTITVVGLFLFSIGAFNLPGQIFFALTLSYFIWKSKHRLTRAHREKQLKMSCQALHNAPPNRT